MKIRLPFLAALAAASLSFQASADCAAVETAPAATQAAAPATAPAVASAPAAAATPGTSAVIQRAVTLRDRPQANSMGSVVASADKRVRLERGIKNADGSWWYVSANGLGGGWVLESEISGPQQQ